MRGPEGTEVRLSIERTGQAEPLDVVVKRAKIDRPAVSWTMVPGSTIADIRLDQFQSGSADEVKAALTAAEAAGATGAVLDLRGNPGGYVDEARDVVSQFLAHGVVYQTRDARGVVNPNDVVEGGVALDLPIVVLVDAGTASSSEITAGALQDAGRAKVVGVKTFGTGTVLGEFPLTDGSALRIGTVEWLTPEGRRIWHEGITPDVTVELPTDVFPALPDDLAALSPAKVAATTDAQLLKALELLDNREPLAGPEHGPRDTVRVVRPSANAPSGRPPAPHPRCRPADQQLEEQSRTGPSSWSAMGPSVGWRRPVRCRTCRRPSWHSSSRERTMPGLVEYTECSGRLDWRGACMRRSMSELVTKALDLPAGCPYLLVLLPPFGS